MAIANDIASDLVAISTFMQGVTLTGGATALKTVLPNAQNGYPRSIQDGDLPMLVIFAEPAIWQTHAITLKRYDRTYRMELFVLPVAQGLDFNEGYTRVPQYLDAIGKAIAGNLMLRTSLYEVTQVQGSWRDAGVQQLTPWNGVTYWGSNISIVVTEKFI